MSRTAPTSTRRDRMKDCGRLRHVPRGASSNRIGHGRPASRKSSCPCQPNPTNCRLLRLSIPMRPLLEPVLPPGFEFAVIDQDGQVHFHSDTQRNVHENLLVETDQNRRLQSLVTTTRRRHRQRVLLGQAVSRLRAANACPRLVHRHSPRQAAWTRARPRVVGSGAAVAVRLHAGVDRAHLGAHSLEGIVGVAGSVAASLVSSPRHRLRRSTARLARRHRSGRGDDHRVDWALPATGVVGLTCLIS